MPYKSIWRPTKDEIAANNGAVVAANPLAAEAGIEILQAGGNAVDAAVTIGFCLAVVEPYSSSLGGHGQMLIHSARTARSVAIDFSHRAPRAAWSEMFQVVGQAESGNAIGEVKDAANACGYRSAGVPGVVAGLLKAHELFAGLPLEQLLEPAIHLAEQGFACDWLFSLRTAEAMRELSRYPAAAQAFLPEGFPPRSGVDRIVQRDLGLVLRQISRRGKDGFYRGDIPRALEDDMLRNGGHLRAEDLENYEPDVHTPYRVRYGPYNVLGVARPGGGTTVLQTLNLLKHLDIGKLPPKSPEYLHLFLEASRHAFADRYRYLGDPDCVAMPLSALLSDAYAFAVAGTVNRTKATVGSSAVVQPWADFASRALHNPWPFQVTQPEECTTHFTVMDSDRNTVSCTQTNVGNFGSKVVVPGTGILLSNTMIVFHPAPGFANSIASYKQGLSNMSPLLVLNGDRPYLSLGAPGGRKIMSCICQVFLNVVEHGMGMQEAVTAPRVDAAEREVHADSRIQNSVVQALRQMGHPVRVIEETAAEHGFARPMGLLLDQETGTIHTGVDVFRPAVAMGY